MTRPSLRPRRAASQAGFTLIELMIALAIMLIGLLALWTMHTSAIRSNANAHRIGMATMLAQDAMEMLSGETWIDCWSNPDLSPTGTCGGAFPAATVDGLETLPCFIDPGGVLVNGAGATTTTLGPSMYLRSYHVGTVGGDPDQLLIRVRVTYGEPQTGKRHGVTLGTTRMIQRWDPMNMSVGGC